MKVNILKKRKGKDDDDDTLDDIHKFGKHP